MPQATSIINLQYADDTLLFGRSNIKQAVILKWILRCFEVWSGLKINFHKSSLGWLGKRSSVSSFIVSIFGYKEEGFLLKYLGILLRPNKLQRAYWTPLMKSFERKFESWKRNLLSLCGRPPLLNVVLSVASRYFMSYFVLPKWMRDEIDKIWRKFLSSGSSSEGGKYHLVCWARCIDLENMEDLECWTWKFSTQHWC